MIFRRCVAPYVHSAKCGRVGGTATESYIKGKLSHECFPRSRLCKRCEAVSYLNILLSAKKFFDRYAVLLEWAKSKGLISFCEVSP